MTTTSIFFLVNLVGGLAVLGSYCVGLYLYPDQRTALWGGVVGNWKTLFTTSMFFAAAGYLAFCYTMTISDGANESSFFGKYTFIILAAVFLFSASVWMPATLQYLDTKNEIWWIVSVTSLWITAASLTCMGLAFNFTEFPNVNLFQNSVTLIGIIWITFHCLVFDAIIWVAKFP